jgi:hypothetical protein
MKRNSRLTSVMVMALLVLLAALSTGTAQQKGAAVSTAGPKASLPILLTSCGQSPGYSKFEVFFNTLKMPYTLKLDATPADLAKTPFKTVIIVTGASLKGMGAAGVSMEDEIARTKALIAAAKKQNIKVIGAHIEGMARRAQGASPGDNSDELSIDTVCPFSSLLIVKKEGDEDGRFTTISKDKGVPLITYDKNMDLQNVLRDLFSK